MGLTRKVSILLVPRSVQSNKLEHLLNYYAKFLLNLSTELAPCILFCVSPPSGKGKCFPVPRNCSRGSKQEAGSSLSCDASPYGVGVVLSHVKDDNFEIPIGHVSRTLSVAEKS